MNWSEIKEKVLPGIRAWLQQAYGYEPAAEIEDRIATGFLVELYKETHKNQLIVNQFIQQSTPEDLEAIAGIKRKQSEQKAPIPFGEGAMG